MKFMLHTTVLILCFIFDIGVYACDIPVQFHNISGGDLYINVEGGPYTEKDAYEIHNDGNILFTASTLNDTFAISNNLDDVNNTDPYYASNVTVLKLTEQGLRTINQGDYLTPTEQKSGSECSDNAEVCYFGNISKFHEREAELIEPAVGQRKQIEPDQTFTELYPSDTDGSTVEITAYEMPIPKSTNIKSTNDMKALGSEYVWSPIGLTCDAYGTTPFRKQCTTANLLHLGYLYMIKTTFNAYGGVPVTNIVYGTTESVANSVLMTKPTPNNSSKAKTGTTINLLFRGPGELISGNINNGSTVVVKQKLSDGSESNVDFNWKIVSDNRLLTLKPKTALAENSTITITITNLQLTDGTMANYTDSFITTNGNPIVIFPNPLDKMSLNNEIEIQYPNAAIIDKNTINNDTFKVTDSGSGEVIPGDYKVDGDIVIFTRDDKGLWQESTTYVVDVSGVTDSKGNLQNAISIPVTTIDKPAGQSRIIFEAIGPNGDGYTPSEIRGLGYADQLCDNDPNKPQDVAEGTHFKAILGSWAQNPYNRRWAANQFLNGDEGRHNWVLLPNQDYSNGNNQFIGTTNDNSVFNTGDLANPIFSAAQSHSWSGLNTFWEVQMFDTGSLVRADCNGWTSSSSYAMGSLGNHSTPDVDNMLYDDTYVSEPQNGLDPCTSRHTFACAEQ